FLPAAGEAGDALLVAVAAGQGKEHEEPMPRARGSQLAGAGIRVILRRPKALSSWPPAPRVGGMHTEGGTPGQSPPLAPEQPRWSTSQSSACRATADDLRPARTQPARAAAAGTPKTVIARSRTGTRLNTLMSLRCPAARAR